MSSSRSFAAASRDSARSNSEPGPGARSARPPVPDGLPGALRRGLESLSGLDLGDVRVHANSSRPAAVDALAFAQGRDIHLAPGQERHLPHEAWHIVQQRQGRVQATLRHGGVAINDDPRLEGEADTIAARLCQPRPTETSNRHLPVAPAPGALSGIVQCKTYKDGKNTWDADHTFTPRAAAAATPYKLIEDNYKTGLKAGWEKLLTPNVEKADIPQFSVATKEGASSSSARGNIPSNVETQVKQLGMTEQWLKADKNTPSTEYAGGHLIAWNILMDDSNVFANIAPQASKFNSPAYYNTFEQIGQYSAEKVKIQVKLTYAQTTYDVDQDALVRKKILTQTDSSLPAKVTIPARIPSDWEATVEVVDSSKELGSTGKAKGKDVYFDSTKFAAAKITASKKRGFKMLVDEGADPTTGETGGKKKRVKLKAKQLF